MGSFDNLLKTGLSSLAGNSQQHPGMSLATGILEMISSQQGGGLQGLVESFKQKGLGDVVSSWVSTGPNMAVSGDQVQSVLGSDAIKSLAERAGVSPDTASSMLAQVLPGIVDKLTPDGRVPESSNLLGEGLSMLKGLKF